MCGEDVKKYSTIIRPTVERLLDGYDITTDTWFEVPDRASNYDGVDDKIKDVYFSQNLKFYEELKTDPTSVRARWRCSRSIPTRIHSWIQVTRIG